MNHERMPGVAIARVVEVKDPDHLGRIRVKYPWREDAPESRWIPIAAPMAGKDRGTYFMPEIDDEVLVAFDQGMFDHAYVIGFLWNHKQKPPSPDERQRVIKSTNGHAIRFVDSTKTAGNEGALIIADSHGNTIMLTNSHITIHSRGALRIEGMNVTINGRLVRSAGPPI